MLGPFFRRKYNKRLISWEVGGVILELLNNSLFSLGFGRKMQYHLTMFFKLQTTWFKLSSTDKTQRNNPMATTTPSSIFRPGIYQIYELHGIFFLTKWAESPQAVDWKLTWFCKPGINVNDKISSLGFLLVSDSPALLQGTFIFFFPHPPYCCLLYTSRCV